jgi:hypothetical protein
MLFIGSLRQRINKVMSLVVYKIRGNVRRLLTVVQGQVNRQGLLDSSIFQ